MKKTLIAVAVASLIAPLAAQADSTFVGSMRYGVAFNDPGDGADAEASVRNFGSRIKWSGSGDLDNGMSAFGKYELRLNNERDSADDLSGGIGNRMYHVGVKGGFGAISLGLQDSAWDLVNPDRTWWNGGTGLLGNRSEKKGVLKYDGNFGDVAFSAAATMQAGDDDGDAVDIFDAAVLYAANGIRAGVGMQTLAGDGDPVTNDGTAFAVHGGYDFGGADIQLTYGVEDEDYTGSVERTGIYFEAGFGDAYVWYGQREFDGGDAPTGLGIGYTQSLGKQTLIWYELFQNDPDDGSDADVGLNATLKVDF